MGKRSKIKLTFSWLIVFVLMFSPLASAFMPIAAAETSGDFEVSVSYDANGGSGEMKPLTVACMESVSYTHLDVYKRQVEYWAVLWN